MGPGESEALPLPPSPRVPPPPNRGDGSPPDFLEATWDAGRAIIRVGLDPWPPVSFYVPTRETRFGPFRGAHGRDVPVLYGADTRAGALSETVFHDVPVRGAVRSVRYQDLAHRFLVEIVPQRSLRLADFTSRGLARIGIDRREMIETGPGGYEVTARWSAAVHADPRDFDGITWVSRQDDQSHAVVLFGDRLDAERDLPATTDDALLRLTSWEGFDTVAKLADQMGIVITGLPGLA